MWFAGMAGDTLPVPGHRLRRWLGSGSDAETSTISTMADDVMLSRVNISIWGDHGGGNVGS